MRRHLVVATAAVLLLGAAVANARPTSRVVDPADITVVEAQPGDGWLAMANKCGVTLSDFHLLTGIPSSEVLHPRRRVLCPAPSPTTTTTTSTEVTTSTVAPTTTEFVLSTTSISTSTTAPSTSSTSTTTTSTLPPSTSSTPATTTTTTQPPSSSVFVETFDGAPASPQPFTEWDTFVRHRDLPAGQMIPVDAQHDAMCGPPPATHHVTDIPGMVFQCRDHMMTAIDGGEYGALYLTPQARVDFSQAALNAAGVDSAEVSWKISTGFASGRDWWDVWILPVDEEYPGEDWYPDDQFTLPPNGVHVRLSLWERGNTFRLGVNVYVIRNGVRTFVNTQDYYGIDWALEQCGGTLSDTIRDKFTLRISETSLSFVFEPVRNGQTCPHWFVDPITIPALGWTDAAVKFGHHSYNPFKDGMGDHPGTWHWDDVKISPAR